MITMDKLFKMKVSSEKITMLTCYDSSFAGLFDSVGLDCILVGDSLGMVIQGHSSTLPVKLKDMIYHTYNVSRVLKNSLLISDLPFGTYNSSKKQALRSSIKLLKAGAKMVKLEGGLELLDTVRFLSERDINVCVHLGFRPQAVDFMGLKVQGRDNALDLKFQALEFEKVGARMILLEMVTRNIASDITDSVSVPVIGIGSGICDGQVLVSYDILGIYQGKVPRFAKNFLEDSRDIKGAILNYIKAVKDQSFPASEHCFD